MRRTVSLIISIVLVVLCLTGCSSEEKKAAIADFEAEAARIEKQLQAFNELIVECQKLSQTEQTALDESLRCALETAISNGKVSAAIEIPKIARKAEEIVIQAAELKTVDFTADESLLQDAKASFEKSLRQYALVTNPSEAYVIACLKGIEHISALSAVTEDNDPNGNLNKPGGYTATVYYADDRINLDKEIYGNTVIEQGTDGGGAIEVYATVEDAEKRREYLATFDGTIFASGTHTVIGTVLVRTSNELKASQQKEMEDRIIEALTAVD